MATKVDEPIEVVLDNGVRVIAKPLKIKALREFMKAFKGLSDAKEDNDEFLDTIVSCVQIALRQYGLNDDRDYIEDNFELKQLYRVIEGASGIKVDDDSPNPQ